MPLIQQFSYSQKPAWKQRIDDNATALATTNMLPSSNVDETTQAFNGVFSNPITKVIVTKIAHWYFVIYYLDMFFGKGDIFLAMTIINLISFGLTALGK